MTLAAASVPGVDFRVNDVIAGRYRVESVLGRGGAGTVYRAQALGMNHRVAVKVMHDHDVSAVERQRFEREARLAQQLRHPHTSQILDLKYLGDGRPCLVYELLQGRSLRRALEEEGAFSVARTTGIALRVLEAVAAAHAAGILHRDIKPANIFLEHTRDGEVPKLLDLGVAAAPEQDREGPPLTAAGQRLGTPRYMSPEMARGQTVGPASDLYSLGLVIAEMLVARPVLEANLQIELLMAHASDDAHRLDINIIDSALYPILARALAKDLTVRYQTALQMRADLEALLERFEADEQDPLSASADLMPTLAVSAASLGLGPAEGWVPASTSLAGPPSSKAIPPPSSAIAVREAAETHAQLSLVPDKRRSFAALELGELPAPASSPEAMSLLPGSTSLPPAGEAFQLPSASSEGLPRKLTPASAQATDASLPVMVARQAATEASPTANAAAAGETPQRVRQLSSPLSRRKPPPAWVFGLALLFLAALAGLGGYLLGR